MITFVPIHIYYIVDSYYAMSLYSGNMWCVPVYCVVKIYIVLSMYCDIPL